MSSLSHFQTLPVLLVEMIVEYVGKHTRNTFDDQIRKHNKRKSILRPLLHVSVVWRSVVMSNICDNCVIRLKYFSNSVDVKYPAWPDGLTYPRTHRTIFVKRVTIWVPFWSEISKGKFTEANAILRSKGSNVVFPNATSLVLYFFKPRERQPLRLDNFILGNPLAPPPPPPAPKPIVPVSPEIVSGLARFLKRLAPGVTSVTGTFHIDGRLDANPERPFDDLLTMLCKGNVNTFRAYSYHYSSRVTLDSLPIAGLTSLVHQNSMVCPPFGRLARLNASTLTRLTVGLLEPEDWPTFIIGEDEKPVVYPCLITLRIHITHGIQYRYETTLPPINNAAPFPNITALEVKGAYPFDDDMIFRGNGATLKNLRIPVLAIHSKILSRFNVLGRSGVSRMNAIHIDMLSDWLMDRRIISRLFTEDDTSMMDQFPIILETATTMTLGSDTKLYHAFKALCKAPPMAVLQHLTIKAPVYTTLQIIQVIQAIPTLKSFACDLSKKVSGSTEAMPDHELPATLREKYYPLSHNFTKLTASRGGCVSTNKMAIAAMQIAIICPSFNFVEVLPGLRKDLKHKIGLAMAKDRFKPYADLVRHLL
ncbi:hypothetical protein H4218_003457 [Coemansia sp. IMI 209128]|nr:hypothetical protein GGI10_000419 [Coemansia sp. RSA 2530]KAJ2698171.1 hypothetical protein H4218_003457 [Coemansia sp. IMI 209128]